MTDKWREQQRRRNAGQQKPARRRSFDIADIGNGARTVGNELHGGEQRHRSVRRQAERVEYADQDGADAPAARKSAAQGQSGPVRVDLAGPRIIRKYTKQEKK